MVLSDIDAGGKEENVSIDSRNIPELENEKELDLKKI